MAKKKKKKKKHEDEGADRRKLGKKEKKREEKRARKERKKRAKLARQRREKAKRASRAGRVARARVSPSARRAAGRRGGAARTGAPRSPARRADDGDPRAARVASARRPAGRKASPPPVVEAPAAEPWVVRHVAAYAPPGVPPAPAPPSARAPERHANGSANGPEQRRARRLAGLFGLPDRYLDVVQFRLDVIVLDESGVPSHNPVLSRTDGTQVCWLNLGPVDRTLTFDAWPFEGEPRGIVIGAHAYSASHAPDLTRLGRMSSAYEVDPPGEPELEGMPVPTAEITVED